MRCMEPSTKTWGGPTKAFVDLGDLKGRESVRGAQGGCNGLRGNAGLLELCKQTQTVFIYLPRLPGLRRA